MKGLILVVSWPGQGRGRVGACNFDSLSERFYILQVLFVRQVYVLGIVFQALLKLLAKALALFFVVTSKTMMIK